MRTLTLALCLGLAACSPKPAAETAVEPVKASEPAPDPSRMLGAWIVSGAGDVALTTAATESNPATQSWFHIKRDRIEGNLFCNSFGATYSAQYDTIDFESPGQTLIGCGDSGNAVEMAISSAIRNATNWSIGADDTLTLSDGGETLLTARRPGAGEDAYKLFGFWRVTALDGAPVIRPEGEDVTIAFQRDTIGGTSFCNSWGGGYKVVGEILDVSNVESTAAGCADDYTLFKVLGSGATLDFADDGTFTLSNNGHSLTAEPF